MHHFLRHQTFFVSIIALGALLMAMARAQAPAREIVAPRSVPAESSPMPDTLSSRDVQRQEMRQLRTQLQKQRAQEEAACRTKFQVNDCLDDVRERYRGPLLEIRRKELALNEEERKAKGEEQLRLIEKRKEKAGIPSRGVGAGVVSRSEPPPLVETGPGRTLDTARGGARAQEAKEASRKGRAEQQRRRVENKEAENTARETNRVERERSARQHYDVKLHKAEKRKAEQRAASGTTQGAAGLPVPP